MDERILRQLENIPCVYADAFGELTHRVKSQAKEKGVSDREKQRLEYELEVIKQTGTAKMFLFGSELASCHSDSVVLGVENYSLVNYTLGVSAVNPVPYNLPFERFINCKKKVLPTYCFYVKKGCKGLFLQEVYKKFGQGSIAKALDADDLYFVSANGLKNHLIKNVAIIANKNQRAYTESVSVLLAKELAALNYYSLYVKEVEDIKKTKQICFSETEILERANRLFDFHYVDLPQYFGIKEVEDILKNTNQKLIYQEQLMEILNSVCNYNMAEADYFRLAIAKRNKENLQGLLDILTKKFGKKGETLFQYLYKNTVYAVAKAYVITNLQIDVKFN